MGSEMCIRDRLIEFDSRHDCSSTLLHQLALTVEHFDGQLVVIGFDVADVCQDCVALVLVV